MLGKLPCTWGRRRLCFHISASLRSQGSGTDRHVQRLQPAHPGDCTQVRVTPRPVPTCSHSLGGCQGCRKSKLQPHRIHRTGGCSSAAPLMPLVSRQTPSPLCPVIWKSCLHKAGQCPCPRSSASQRPVHAALPAGQGTASYSWPRRTSDRLPLFTASCHISTGKRGSLQKPRVPGPER